MAIKENLNYLPKLPSLPSNSFKNVQKMLSEKDSTPDYGSVFSAPSSKYSNINKDASSLGRITAHTVGRPLADAEKVSQIPSGYPIVSGRDKVTEQSRFSGMPEFLGGGQYISDPSLSGELIKSERTFEPLENAYLRGGLSRAHFQIDHILPLWVGGTDTLANKQIISNADHEKKTKVGAVARTLLYANKINRNEAQIMAMDWRSKDVDGIEIDNNDNGNIVGNSIGIAESKQKEWKEVPKVGIKEWLSAFKEGKKGVAGEFAQSAAAGITGGWIPETQYEYEDETERKKVAAARIGGQIVGTMAGFIALGGIVKSLAGVTGLTSLAKSTPLAQKLAAPGAAFKAGKIIVPTSKAAKTLESMGLFALHGQLSKQDENIFKERAKNLMMDLSYGALLGGAGQNLKSYAGIGAGSYALSYLDGAEPEDALTNSVIMMGLHGLGYPGGKKKGEYIKKRIETKANEFAYKERGKWLAPEKKTSLGVNKFSMEKIQNENVKIRKNIIDAVNTGAISPHEANEALKKSIISGRQLWKGGLSKEARLREEVADLLSVSKRIKKESIPGKNAGTPNNFVEYLYKNRDATQVAGKPGISDYKIKGDVPEGRVWLTGVSEKIDKRTSQNIKDFKSAIDRGTAEKKVYLVNREDLQWLTRSLNAEMKPADIKAGKLKPYANPQNNIEAWAIVGNKMVNVGYVPRGWSIEGKTNSQNNRIRSLNKQHKKKGGYTLQEMDPNINKDTIASAMKNNKIEVLEVPVESINAQAVQSGQPYIIANFKKQAWGNAIDKNAGVKSLTTGQAEAFKSSLKKIEKNIPASKQIENIPASKGEGSFYEKSSRDNVSSIVGDVEKIIKTQDHKELQKFLNNKFGVSGEKIFSEEVAKSYFNQTNKKTVSDLIRDIEDISVKNAERVSDGGLEFLLNITNLQKNDFNFLNAWNSIKDVQINQAVKKTSPKITKMAEVVKPVVKAEPKKIVIKKPVTVKPVQKESIAKDVVTKKQDVVAPKTIKISAANRAKLVAPKATAEDLKYKNIKKVVLKEGSKGKNANTIYKNLYEATKHDLENIQLPGSSSGKLSRQNYIKRINSIFDGIRIDNKQLKNNRLTLKDGQNIKKQIKDDLLPVAEDLVYTKFDVAGESKFTQKTEKKIIEDTMESLGIKKEQKFKNVEDAVKGYKDENLKKFASEFYKKEGRLPVGDEMIQYWAEAQKKKDLSYKYFGDIFKKYGKPSTLPQAASIKKFSDNLKNNIKTKAKDSYSYGYSYVLDKGLSKAFGDKYSTSWALNPFFNTYSAKGKNFWDNMSSSQGRQAVSSVLAYTKKLKEKPRSKWTTAEWKEIYGKRAKEAEQAYDSKYELKDKKITKQEADAISSGLRIQEEGNFLYDTTELDKMSFGLLSSEITGEKLTANKGANDAMSLLLKLVQSFNLSNPKKKVFIGQDFLDNLVKEVK